tara:strand:- start:196 stop:435 length:240 start_codon:yes stop_codon:yes gene_type:complete
MNRFLLLALTAGFLSPIAAKSESYKLLIKVREVRSVSTSVLTMASKEACEKGKKKVLDVDNWEGSFSVNGLAAICIKSE